MQIISIMKKIILITVFSFFFSSCSKSQSNEINRIATDYISFLAKEDAKSVKDMFPADENSLTTIRKAIKEVKDEFKNKHQLSGWGVIRAEGYFFSENTLMIFCSDAKGKFFEIHELLKLENSDRIIFIIKNIDIDNTWSNKEELKKMADDEGFKINWIH